MDYVLFLLLFAIPDVFTSPELQVNNLPGNIIPDSYNLQFNIDPTRDEYDGTVEILITCKQATKMITLSANDEVGLKIPRDQISVQKKNNGKVKDILNVEYGRGLINIELKEALSKSQYVLQLKFSGTMTDKLTGLIRVKDGKGYSVLSNFKRTTTSHVFPCLDDIYMKAKFTLTISYVDDPNAETQVFSNSIVSSRNRRNHQGVNTEDVQFKETDEIFAYQLSFLITRSKKKEIASNTTPIEVTFWCNENSKFANQFMKSVQRRLGTDLNRNPVGETVKTYKLDYVLLEVEMEMDIETPGLIIKREKDYWNEVSNSEENAHRFLAESMEKQIFSRTLPTTTWWDQWVLECLAKYLSLLVLSKEAFRRELFLQALTVMESDSTTESKSVIEDSEILANPERKLGKGLLILFTVDSLIRWEEMKIGEILGKFENDYVYLYKFLTEILKKHLKGQGQKVQRNLGDVSQIITIVDWFKELRVSSTEEKAKYVIHGWLQNAGYPVINVFRTNYRAELTQSRFYSDLVKPKNTDCWYTPFTWLTSVNDQYLEPKSRDLLRKQWLFCKEDNSSILNILNIETEDWIVFINKMPGYCRVNYTIKKWYQIKDLLNDKSKYSHIAPEHRAQLINDALVMSYSGGYEIDIVTAFQLVSYLRHDTATDNDVVWLSFFDGMERFKRIVEKTDLNKTKYMDVMKLILTNIYKEIFPSANIVKSYIKDDNYDPSYAMKSLIHKESCSSGVPDCLQHSTEVYNEWKSGQLKITEFPKRLSRELFTSVLCSKIQSDSSETEYIVGKIDSVDTRDTHRKMLVDGMSCLRDVDKMKGVFDWCFQTEEESLVEMKSNLFVNFLKGPYTYAAASDYFIEKHEAILQYFRQWAEKKVINAMQHMSSLVKTIACETSSAVASKLKNDYLGKVELSPITMEEVKSCNKLYDDDAKWLQDCRVEFEKALDEASKALTTT